MKNYSKLLWNIDAYKVGHMNQYEPSVQYVHSVFQMRSNKTFTHVPVFGLQYFIKEYLTKPISREEVDELLTELKTMGIYHIDIETKLYALADLGYLPLLIRAVPEGTIVSTPNAIATIQNTVPGFHWVVGLVETLLLQWWSTLSTSAQSLQYARIAGYYFNETSDANYSFNVHDFGLRGATCPEHGALTGAAHALTFSGSDTIITLPFLRQYYNAEGFVFGSVPASEHSVMCSFGREREIAAFEHMLDTYPTGIVSIVADTYDWYNVLDTVLPTLKDKILARDGKTTVRPDSGSPEKIILGEHLYHMSNKEYSTRDKGALRMLDEVFGSTKNSKGYKVLSDKVGLLYGDGMYPARYINVLQDMKSLGYSAENLVIGVGGILRNHTRDTLGCAIKATAVITEGNDSWVGIEKDPVTDSNKKSYYGRVKLVKTESGYETICAGHKETDEFNEATCELRLAFLNGNSNDLTWEEVEMNYMRSTFKYLPTLTEKDIATIRWQKPVW